MCCLLPLGHHHFGEAKRDLEPPCQAKRPQRAEALLHAMNGTIDSMTKTAVFFSLQPKFLWKNGWTTMAH
jgi:hypothetical protein